MIQTEGLTKKFNRLTAIQDLNLSIGPGEIFGFLGPNGAGKTTTIKCLCGLLKPSSGRASIGGYDIVAEPLNAKKIIGLVPDHPFIYQRLTGSEFLEFISEIYSVQDGRKRIDELFKLFELEEWKDILIENYSHGMKQKLIMASVILHSPRVIFLDEPMVGLDPRSGRMVKEIFQNLARKGTTIFMSTHTLEIAEKICTRIGILKEGRLIALGTKEELQALAKKEGNLEDVFIHLTAGREYADLIELL